MGKLAGVCKKHKPQHPHQGKVSQQGWLKQLWSLTYLLFLINDTIPDFGFKKKNEYTKLFKNTKYVDSENKADREKRQPFLRQRQTVLLAHFYSEVLKTLVVRQCILQFGVDFNLLPRVLQKCPELLQSIQLICATNRVQDWSGHSKSSPAAFGNPQTPAFKQLTG